MMEECASSMRLVSRSLPLASASFFLYTRRIWSESALRGTPSTCNSKK